MRTMMTVETIDHNVECIKKQMQKFIDFSDGKAILENNANWLRNLNYIDFLRDIGEHFQLIECLQQNAISQEWKMDYLSQNSTI